MPQVEALEGETVVFLPSLLCSRGALASWPTREIGVMGLQGLRMLGNLRTSKRIRGP